MRNNTKLFFLQYRLGLGCGGGGELTTRSSCGNSEIFVTGRRVLDSATCLVLVLRLAWAWEIPLVYLGYTPAHHSLGSGTRILISTSHDM